MCPAVCSPQAAGTEAVLFANNDLERPVADAMRSLISVVDAVGSPISVANAMGSLISVADAVGSPSLLGS